MSGGTVPLRLISLILLFSLIPPARASYVAPKQIWTNKWDNCFAAAGARYQIEPLLLKAISAGESSLRPGAININKDKKTGKALMNPLMILVKIIKLRWIHILSYDQMVSRKINNQTTRCANSIFYTTLFTNSAPNYT